MAWQGSDRRSELPSNWNALVKQVKERDGGRCRWTLPSGARCPRPGSDVDHRYSPTRHGLADLWLLCRAHHDKKTQGEARFGRRRRKAPGRAPEAHPGLRRR